MPAVNPYEDQKDERLSAAEALIGQIANLGKTAVSLAGASPPPTTVPGATPPSTPPSDEMAGKIMTAGGMLASAVNPKQFGQAGQMLTGLGTKEVERARVSNAAQALGYASPEALTAGKAAADIAESRAKGAAYGAGALTDVAGKLPLYQAEAGKSGAQVGQIGAATEALRQETEFKKLMKPMPITISGQTFVVDPAHALTGYMHNQTLAFQYAKLAQDKSLAEPQRRIYDEQAKILATRIPVPGQVDASGQPLTLDPSHFVQMMATTNRDFAAKYGRQIQMLTEVDKIINQDVIARGDASKLPTTSKAAIKQVADQFLSDPAWSYMGMSLYARLGLAPPTQSPSAGSVLTQPTIKVGPRGKFTGTMPNMGTQTAPFLNMTPR